jgi:hypothetical protein
MLKHVRNISGVPVRYVTENEYLEFKDSTTEIREEFCNEIIDGI